MTGAPSAETVASFDGTNLASFRLGSQSGRPVVLVNAIGPDISSWRPLLRELDDRADVVTWDLRGLHGSEPGRSDRIDAGSHARDALTLIDHWDVRHPVVVAWSTGTRIALELARLAPERLAGVVVVCGAFGRGFRGLFRYLELSSVFPRGAGIVKHFAGSLETPFRSFVRRPEIAGLIRQSGVIGPTADIEALVAVLQSFAEGDLRMLLRTYEEVVGDADPAILEEVHTPALVLAGGRDRFTTAGMVDAMIARLPLAQRVTYEKASHFLPLEYPRRLASDVLAWPPRDARD